MQYSEVVQRWNVQADWQNQWDTLGEDEKIEFALKVQSEVCALLVEAEHVGTNVSDACDNDGDAAYNRALRDGAAAIREAVDHPFSAGPTA